MHAIRLKLLITGRSTEDESDAKIIAASGLTSVNQIENEGLIMGEILVKPFTSKKLLTTIAKLLADTSE